MPFEIGIFHEFPRCAGQAEAEAFTQSFAQVDAAERWGLDVIWLAELHFLPERSVASAPLLIASAIAARTRRMKIGIAVQVLPLCHPLRLAEEVATLDHISHGRLILGVGRSGFPRTYEAYGVPYGESRERFVEVLEILKRSWNDERFSFEGSFYKFQKYHNCPAAVAETISPVAHCSNERRHLSGDRRYGLTHFRCRPPRYYRGTGSEHSGLSRGLPVRWSCGARRSISASPDLCRRDRDVGAGRPRAINHAVLQDAWSPARGLGEEVRCGRDRATRRAGTGAADYQL
jgi:hypothetical protein